MDGEGEYGSSTGTAGWVGGAAAMMEDGGENTEKKRWLALITPEWHDYLQ
jgi:hypothetical protein